MKTTFRTVVVTSFAALLAVGCAPRQDPGIPLPRDNPNNRGLQRDSEVQTAKPQTPTTPVPQSGKPD